MLSYNKAGQKYALCLCEDGGRTEIPDVFCKVTSTENLHLRQAPIYPLYALSGHLQFHFHSTIPGIIMEECENLAVGMYSEIFISVVITNQVFIL